MKRRFAAMLVMAVTLLLGACSGGEAASKAGGDAAPLDAADRDR